MALACSWCMSSVFLWGICATGFTWVIYSSCRSSLTLVLLLTITTSNVITRVVAWLVGTTRRNMQLSLILLWPASIIIIIILVTSSAQIELLLLLLVHLDCGSRCTSTLVLCLTALFDRDRHGFLFVLRCAGVCLWALCWEVIIMNSNTTIVERSWRLISSGWCNNRYLDLFILLLRWVSSAALVVSIIITCSISCVNSS